MAAAYAIKARYYVARREPAALVLTVQQSSRNGGAIADDLSGFAGRPASVEGLSFGGLESGLAGNNQKHGHSTGRECGSKTLSSCLEAYAFDQCC